MKIKLALLEKDSNYLNRIVNTFNIKYAEKLEIYSFTDERAAYQTLSSTPIDVLIAGEQFDIEVNSLPARCSLAYFVEANNIDTVKDKPAICKFQKADLIYKQILSIYSETASHSTKIRFDENVTRTMLFASASGGVGTSTIAAVCAVVIARQSRKVLYLNLERFGDTDSLFKGDGQFTFGDVIYAIKSKKSNLSLKLESAVKLDASGVSFFSSPEIALDIMDLTTEDIRRLLHEIKISGSYDCIILDSDFDFSEKSNLLWNEATDVIMVSDGSDISNLKFERMYKALQILDQQEESNRIEKLSLMYNKFSNKTSKTITGLSVKALGGIPRFEHATTQQVILQVADMGVITKITNEKEA